MMGGWVSGWIDGWMGGWIGRWMDEWIDRQMNGWINSLFKELQLHENLELQRYVEYKGMMGELWQMTVKKLAGVGVWQAL